MLFFWLSYLAIPFLVISIWKIKQTRFKNYGWIFASLFLLLVIWARFIEPNLVRVNYYPLSLPSAKLDSEIRIAVLSDTHIGLFTKPYILAEAVKKINLSKPDLVLIPGDLVYRLPADKIAAYLAPLKKIEAPAVAVTGNHDNGFPGESVSPDLYRIISSNKLEFINNKTIIKTIRGKRLEIIGVGDLWSDNSDMRWLNNPKQGDISILLTHNPDLVYNFYNAPHLSNRLDFTISGHTHGGQIRIPLVYKYFIPSMYRFDRGWYFIKNLPVFVSSGVGTVSLPVRFMIMPEVAVINIK